MTKASNAPSEWFAKGDGDLRTAEMALGTEDPLPDIACYHAQQCAEKYLKGYLTARNIAFKFVHELAYLVRLCIAADGEFASLLGPASELQDYASDVRYPVEGIDDPSPDEAREAIGRARAIREFVRSRMTP